MGKYDAAVDQQRTKSISAGMPYQRKSQSLRLHDVRFLTCVWFLHVCHSVCNHDIQNAVVSAQLILTAFLPKIENHRFSGVLFCNL